MIQLSEQTQAICYLSVKFLNFYIFWASSSEVNDKLMIVSFLQSLSSSVFFVFFIVIRSIFEAGGDAWYPWTNLLTSSAGPALKEIILNQSIFLIYGRISPQGQWPPHVSIDHFTNGSFILL